MSPADPRVKAEQELAELRALVREWDAAVHGDGWGTDKFATVAEADAALRAAVAGDGTCATHL